jgi:ankyrin repeat protein
MAPNEQTSVHSTPASLGRFGQRAVLGGVLLCACLVIVWIARQHRPLSPAVPTGSELEEALFRAIRDGDHAVVQQLADQGANLNARNELGDTALMQAALNADTRMVHLLLQRGAEVQARSRSGDGVLMRAVHDRDKVKLLLDRGAPVEDRPMVFAATLPGSRPTLELLLRSGGKINAKAGGVTPLMTAAFCGDLESVRFLLEHGASAKARTAKGLTPLIEASLSGNEEVVQLLLDRGADPNARYDLTKSGGQLLTPVLAAAVQGDAACLQRLLERGAEVNVQGGDYQRTPLLCAATTASEETVRLLLAKGADLNAKDSRGDTPLTWAKRRGETAIVQLLRKVGGQEIKESRTTKDDEAVTVRSAPSVLTGSAVAEAVAKSLPLLQQSGAKFTSRKECVSCHHQSMVALTTSVARWRGFPVDEEIARQEREHVRAYFEAKPEIVLGQGLDPLLAPWTLWSWEAEQQAPSPLTDALVHYLVLLQSGDGGWKNHVYRPPSDGSAFTFTALAVRGLEAYCPPGRHAEIQTRIARARAWLTAALPADTEDKAMRLLGLRWARASEQSIREATRILLHEQREDGGWAQLPSLPSDAYATGQVLYALLEAGTVPVSHPSYQRGAAWLLRTQRADGSWFVPTRCFPLIPYFNSGFPRGRSQFISETATCWATLALMLSDPGKVDYTAQSGGTLRSECRTAEFSRAAGRGNNRG